VNTFRTSKLFCVNVIGCQKSTPKPLWALRPVMPIVGASGVGSPVSPCWRTQPKLTSFMV
jgi:hypothetical protein